MIKLPDTKTFELRVTPTRTQLFTFSAITWNRHKIHFDQTQARAEGLADVAVHRGLLGNFLSRLVTAWAGPRGRMARLEWKVQQSAFPGQELRCQGELTAISQDQNAQVAECALKILNPEGALVATGKATVRFS